MANVITSVPLSASVSNVRTQARTGPTWRGFAAGRQGNNAKAASNKTQWGYATRSWPNLTPTEQANWNAIAPAGSSGYATFVMAAMQQAKVGNFVPPTAPAAYPTFTQITDPHFAVSAPEYEANWTYSGPAGPLINIQISGARSKGQLYHHPKMMHTLINYDAAAEELLISAAIEAALGFLPTGAALTVYWKLWDPVSGLPGPKIITREILTPIGP